MVYKKLFLDWLETTFEIDATSNLINEYVLIWL